MSARWGGGDRGSVTAEFAVALPAVVLVLMLGAGTLAASSRQVRLEHGAAQAARLAARDESTGRVAAALAQALPGATGSTSTEGDVVCVSATAPAGLPLPLPALSARSCALSAPRDPGASGDLGMRS